MTDLRKYARGKECQIRIPGVCSHDTEKTVLAHLGGGGMGRKRPDFIASWACYECHSAVDGRGRANGFDVVELRLFLMDGIVATQEQLLRDGIIKT